MRSVKYSARALEGKKEGKAAHTPRCEQAHLEERAAAQVDGELCAWVEHALVVGRAAGRVWPAQDPGEEELGLNRVEVAPGLHAQES